MCREACWIHYAVFQSMLTHCAQWDIMSSSVRDFGNILIHKSHLIRNVNNLAKKIRFSQKIWTEDWHFHTKSSVPSARVHTEQQQQNRVSGVSSVCMLMSAHTVSQTNFESRLYFSQHKIKNSSRFWDFTERQGFMRLLLLLFLIHKVKRSSTLKMKDDESNRVTSLALSASASPPD